jgi:carboxyl-terminal processing protease
LKYQTLRLKRTVYGGGGIMPDIFVPIDTTRFTDYHRKVVARGVMNRYSLQYIDNNRSVLQKRFTDFEKFRKDFKVSDKMFADLAEAAKKEGIEMKEQEFEKSKALMGLQIKALVARDLWETNEYYQIMDEENESLQKAIQILRSPGAFEKLLK